MRTLKTLLVTVVLLAGSSACSARPGLAYPGTADSVYYAPNYSSTYSPYYGWQPALPYPTYSYTAPNSISYTAPYSTYYGYSGYPAPYMPYYAYSAPGYVYNSW